MKATGQINLQTDKLQVPERPSLDEAKDAIMAMRAIVVVKHSRTSLFSVRVNGVLEHMGVSKQSVGVIIGTHAPYDADVPHLLVIAERHPLKRLKV